MGLHDVKRGMRRRDDMVVTLEIPVVIPESRLIADWKKAGLSRAVQGIHT